MLTSFSNTALEPWSPACQRNCRTWEDVQISIYVLFFKDFCFCICFMLVNTACIYYVIVTVYLLEIYMPNHFFKIAKYVIKSFGDHCSGESLKLRTLGVGLRCRAVQPRRKAQSMWTDVMVRWELIVSERELSSHSRWDVPMCQCESLPLRSPLFWGLSLHSLLRRGDRGFSK